MWAVWDGQRGLGSVKWAQGLLAEHTGSWEATGMRPLGLGGKGSSLCPPPCRGHQKVASGEQFRPEPW